jgi:hypothetical protein
VLCRLIKRDTPIVTDPSLGLLGRLMAVHPTIIIEHYSKYLDLEDVDSCILRSAIYWELNKNDSDNSRKIRVTRDSAINPYPLNLDRPFTWIFTAKCSENTLRRWNAIPDPAFGDGVYRFAASGSSMGIVEIESLPYNGDTVLLKMLGQANSAKLAFADILKLDSSMELRNDVIEVALKHCIYLEEIKSELNAEDLSFMDYLKQVEGAYQRWVDRNRNEGKIEGEIEGKIKTVDRLLQIKFAGKTLPAEAIDSLSRLSAEKFDEFLGKILELQAFDEVLAWLNDRYSEEESTADDRTSESN